MTATDQTDIDAALDLFVALITRARREHAAKREEAPCTTASAPSKSPERAAA